METRLPTAISYAPVFGGAVARRPLLRSTAIPRTVIALLLGWWLLHLAALLTTAPDLRGAIITTDAGSPVNQVQICLLGLLGASVLMPAIRAIKRSGSTWQYWFFAYLTWSALTLTWSSSPELGLRRFVAMILVSVGAIGIGAGHYGRTHAGPFQFLQHIRLAGLFALLACIPALAGELSLQNLLDATWKTSLRDYGPEIGFALAYAAIGALAARKSSLKGLVRPSWMLLFVLFAMLLLLKSRALIGVTSLVIAVVYFKTRKKTPLFTAIVVSALATALLLGFITTVAFPELPAKIFPYYARGEDENTLEQINGRVPLWSYIWNQAAEQPWTGVGFGSYWTPQRLSAIWRAVGWPAPCAHNGYLDELVQTGLIGIGLFLAFCLAAIRDLWRRLKGPISVPVVITLSWFALFLLINTYDSILQVYFRVPYFFTLAALSSCCAAGAPEVPRALVNPLRRSVPRQ